MLIGMSERGLSPVFPRDAAHDGMVGALAVQRDRGGRLVGIPGVLPLLQAAVVANRECE